MLGGYCLDKHSTRRSRRAGDASWPHIDEPVASRYRPDDDPARVGPPHPTTNASKPSWSGPSRRSSGILSPESHRLEQVSGRVVLVQRGLDVPGGNGLLLDRAK